MNLPHLFASPSPVFPTRRSFLRRAGNGLGLLALAGLLDRQGLLAAEAVYSKQKGYKTVTMIGSENPQLIGAVNAIGKPLFQGQGVTLSLTTVPQGTADATSQVTAATQSNPDALSVVADNTVCQSVLTGLSTIGAKQPKMVNSSCTAPEVVNAVGESGINGITLFTTGDSTGGDHEAQLYRAVMQQYAPNAAGLVAWRTDSAAFALQSSDMTDVTDAAKVYVFNTGEAHGQLLLTNVRDFVWG